MKKIVALLLSAVLMLSCVSGLAENTKHERVYVVAAADGTVKSLTDNIRLENADELTEIVDRTMLTGIQNVGGQETFSLEGETLTWQAQGQDITYQGTSDKAPGFLPVVTLTLDGQEIDAAVLKEKTGEAVLTVSYQAQESVPALAFTLLPLPAEEVSDLQLENAAVLSEMGQQVLVGWAVPGVDADLALPTSFTASFHADHADLSWMLTLSTSDPIDAVCKKLEERIEIDPHAELTEIETLLTALQSGEALPETTGKAKDIALKINELNDGLTQLNDGAAALAEGTAQLSDGASTLQEGAAQLNTGAAELATGAATLSSGATDAEAGAAALDTGLATITENNDTLNAGAQAIFEAILSTANSQLAASGLDAAGIEIPALTAENYAGVLDAVMTQIDQMITIAQAGASLAPSLDDAISAKLQVAQTAQESLTALKAQLDQISAFVTGLQAYTEGVSQASQGATALHTGLTQLSGGAAALAEGATTLSAGASSLSDGTASLHDGSVALKEGAATLHTDGTQQLKDTLMAAEKEAAEKLLPYVKEDLPRALRIYEETRDNAKNSGYDLRPEDMKAVTVYIIRTDLQ